MSNRFDTAIILDSTTYNAGSGPEDNSSGYFGFGIAADGISSSGPRLIAGSGVPAISAPSGSVYLRTDTAQLYQNTDGAATWSQLGSISSGSITLADNSADAFEFIEGTTPYLRFVTTNNAERNRADVSWDFGSSGSGLIDFDIKDNQAGALEIRAGAAGLVMLGFETTNGAEVLSTAAPTVALQATQTQIRITDNQANSLAIGSTGALGMLLFTTTDGSEVVACANGSFRINNNIPLNLGTASDVAVTPNGTNVTLSGTGALIAVDDFEYRLGTDQDGALEYQNGGNQISLRSNNISGAGALAASAGLTVSTGSRVTTNAAVGTGSGPITIGTGATDCTDAGGTGGASGAVNITTGSAASTLGTSGSSSAVSIVTGDSADANSGNIVLTTGTAAATRGVLDVNVATVDLSTQATAFSLIDNSATAATFAQGSSVYLGIATSDAAETISIGVPSAASSTVAPMMRTAGCYSPRWTCVEDFRLRPQLVASIANNDASKITALIGTNAADAGSVFNTGGGITLATAGGANDQMCIRSQTTANQGNFRGTSWSTSNQPIFRAVVRVIDTANIVIAAGLKLSLTAGATLFDNTTDANQVYFGYATDNRYGVGAGNWAAVIRIGGASANVSLRAISTGIHFLTLAVDSSRIARFYLDGALVATSAALTAATTLLPFVGEEALVAAGRHFGACHMSCEQIYV